jgi:hypothetical protein
VRLTFRGGVVGPHAIRRYCNRHSLSLPAQSAGTAVLWAQRPGVWQQAGSALAWRGDHWRRSGCGEEEPCRAVLAAVVMQRSAGAWCVRCEATTQQCLMLRILGDLSVAYGLNVSHYRTEKRPWEIPNFTLRMFSFLTVALSPKLTRLLADLFVSAQDGATLRAKGCSER